MKKYLCTKSMFKRVLGLRPQLQGTVYLLFAVIAFYSIGSHWDVFILQPYPLHSSLTYYVLLLPTQPVTLCYSIWDKLSVPLLSPTFCTLPPRSLRQPSIPSHSTSLMFSQVCVCTRVYVVLCLQSQLGLKSGPVMM